MNFNSFTTSDSAMYSASVVDNTTLFIPLLLQAIGIPQKYMMYTKTLILVSCHWQSHCHLVLSMPTLLYPSLAQT